MKPSTYRKYVLVLLAVLYAFNQTDGLALGMALQDIKHSLQLSDTQLGVMNGIAFSAFYSTFGVALGRWADWGNRVTILSLTRALWGAFVMLTGRVHSFLQLLLVRMGAGVGESGCMPVAFSFISELFSRAERPQALALFFFGGAFSTLLGNSVAGWLIQLYGWRMMFAIMGIPGLLLALVTWLTVKEPRTNTDAGAKSRTDGPPSAAPAVADHAIERASRQSAVPPLWEVTKGLWVNASFRNVALALVVAYFFSAGLTQWQPAFYLRSYGVKEGALGTWLAFAYSIPGIIGIPLGGYIASRWAAGRERVQLVACAALYGSAGIITPFVYLTRDYHLSLVLFGLSTLPFNLMSGPLMAVMAAVLRPQTRALSLTALFFFANLVGSGLGPLLSGVMSDALRPIFGIDSLRYALVLMAPWYLWCGWHVWLASKTVLRDIEIARAKTDDGREVEFEGDFGVGV